ncbi:MAG: M20 peptidase family dipeptidase [Acidimicrobiales bacterium]|nr:MAG: M20 peptidase family dipeptidase [Acidimicrobiales bacterium]
MTRRAASERTQAYFVDGSFRDELAARISIRTESPDATRRPELYRYLADNLSPSLREMGFDCRLHENPVPDAGPFLVATRHESDDLPTVMSYGHADVVLGYDDQWRDGLDPWTITVEGDRWYGRGTADNKGQHTINLAALRSVLEERGHLGFNVVLLFETGEETGSPGLREFCAANAELFEADVFIASDGPRIQADRPTVFMGSRGVFNFSMTLTLREGGHHSGNWGGLLSNPGVILAHALSTMISVDGELLVSGWKAEPMTESVREAISRLSVGDADGPAIDVDWGEPGLSPEERVFGTNTFEVLAFETGNPKNPVNAIPPTAIAHCHMRFVAGTEPDDLLPALRRHLDRYGFAAIALEPAGVAMNATRLDPDHPWAQWAIDSIERTSGKDVSVLPNLGGSLPNDVFADVLELPTIWVPHSYAGCSQHAPNEHLLASTCEEALRVMTGLWWDLGAGDTPQASSFSARKR